MATVPFESESEALAAPAVRAGYAAYEAGINSLRVGAADLLLSACEQAGVTLGAYDRSILVLASRIRAAGRRRGRGDHYPRRRGRVRGGTAMTNWIKAWWSRLTAGLALMVVASVTGVSATPTCMTSPCRFISLRWSLG
jgi:hypothetical protein